jgi:hypothetical protein
VTARLRLLGLPSLVLAAGACAIEYTVPQPESADDGGTDDEGPMCGSGSLECGGECIDPSLSAQHCGQCDRACAAEEACVQGQCVAECDDDELMCDQLCIDIDDDPAHCGGCDQPCAAEEVCDDGQCVEECDESCDDDVELCVDGACTCRAGFVRCNDECVDLSTDSQHCGMCDRDCDEELPCGDGECQPADCPGFPDHCDYGCTDVQSDPLHCGECDHACHPSQDCAGGRCVPGDDD